MGYDISAVDATTKRRIDGESKDTYFRANIFGMRALREAMFEIGMMHHSVAPSSEEWQATPDVPEADWDAIHEGEKPWPAEEVALLARHGSDIAGLPMHKFCSNDSWIVTPDEISQALVIHDAYAAIHPGPPASIAGYADFWGEWIAYLRRAQALGGFEVN